MRILQLRPTRAVGVPKAADGSLVPLTLEEQQRQKLLQQQQQVDGATQQVGSLVQQGVGLLGAGGGAAAGAGGAVAGVAGAAGPIGLALAAGMGVNSMIKGATTDKNGFAKTDTGSTLGRALGSSVDPIGNIVGGISNLGNKDLSTFEKAASFVPGFSAFALRGSVNRARNKYLQQKNKNDVAEASLKSQQANYTGLAYARDGGVVPTFGGGGKPPAAPVGGQPMRGNPEAAKKYYDNVLPAMKGLIGNKHDEVYADPETGKQCTANSCLSFASTVLDAATGSQTQRTKQNLYNPEFTRTAESQGWVPIDMKDARPGDRFQSWQPVGTKTANEAKVADLGGRQALPGRVPVHMTVFGGWAENGQPSAGNAGMANLYQDGHEFSAANTVTRPVTPQEWQVYRYVGVNGQLTNDPSQAVAVNPAATQRMQTPAQRQVIRRAQGGPTPKKVEPWRQPLSEADEVRYQDWVKKLPAGHRQSIDPATGNGRDYDYRRAFKGGVEASENGHFTDKYKLPNHRTFSTESMYYGPDTKDQAGKWEPTPTGGNQWVPLNPKIKKPFVEDKEGRPLPGYATGGTVPAHPALAVSVPRPAAESTGTLRSRFASYTPRRVRTQAENQAAHDGIMEKQAEMYRTGLTAAGYAASGGVGAAIEAVNLGLDVRDAANSQSIGSINSGQAALSAGSLLAKGLGKRKLGVAYGVMSDVLGVGAGYNSVDPNAPAPQPKKRAGYFEKGGTLELPPSVIAEGSLHSEKHDLGELFEKTLTEKGIPIIQLSENDAHNGTQLAELEKDELTMSAELSEKIRELVADKDHQGVGKLVAQQIKTNTIPSSRYKRRLGKAGHLSADQTGTTAARQEKSLAMLGDGGSVQMWLKGGVEHIFSREHTADMVKSSLDAKTAQDFVKLGRRVGGYIKQHQRQAAKNA